MSTQAPEETTHYHVQKKRRADFLEQWRGQRRTGVLPASELVFKEREPGVRVAYFAGSDEGAAMRTNDAGAHELDPGTTTTPHRHSWDAMLFIAEGSGWSEIGGRRIEWKAWDALHLPPWTWHRHGNDGDKAARFLSFSSEPLLTSLNMALIQEAQNGVDVTERPPFASRRDGDDVHSKRVRRLAELQQHIAEARIHTAYDDITLRNTPRGSRTAFLVDESIGYKTSGITAAMFQLAPGQAQTMHRHPGEAFLYVIEGHGRSYIDVEPEGGREYEWGAGDIINVDHFLWHEHRNSDAEQTARLVRVHMFASVLETMRALCDPLDLFNERPEDLAKAFDLSEFEWPPDRRPS
jgi:gentisate 1,2-dioxygenase